MKIAFDARCVYPGMGGIGRYAVNLLAEFAALDRSNEYVCYFNALGKPAENRLPDRCRPRVLQAGMIDERFDQLVLPGLLEDDRADVYFNPTFSVPLIRNRRTRTVATVHDVVFRRHPDLVAERLRGHLDRATSTSCRWADLVLTASEFSKREILELYPAPRKDIRVIPHGVRRTEHPSSPAAEPLRSLGLEPSNYLLYVGSLEPKKNLLVLLEAFAETLKRAPRPNLRLALVGSHDPQTFPLLPALEELGLSRRVVLAGHVPEPALESLYAHSLVFVYPSLYEGFGLPPLEAMCRGIPTIVARTSSLGEVVGDGALVVPPAPSAPLADAMTALLLDEGARRELGRKGLRRAAEFEWSSSARRHLNAFESAVSLS